MVLSHTTFACGMAGGFQSAIRRRVELRTRFTQHRFTGKVQDFCSRFNARKSRDNDCSRLKLTSLVVATFPYRLFTTPHLFTPRANSETLALRARTARKRAGSAATAHQTKHWPRKQVTMTSTYVQCDKLRTRPRHRDTCTCEADAACVPSKSLRTRRASLDTPTAPAGTKTRGSGYRNSHKASLRREQSTR
jgi:hypothetical protein